MEELLDQGSFADPHEPAIYQAMASALARLMELMKPLGAPPSLRGGWNLWIPDRLWPTEAHSPMFDLTATSGGAKWIDELASIAKSQVPSDAETLMAHSDWSGKHFRFDADGEITAIYDWDSLALRTEVQAVGIAAGTFTANFELDIVYAPTPAEVVDFIQAYSEARHVPFNREETIATRAAAAYVIAYTARCEHALGRQQDFTRALARWRDAYMA